MSRWEDRYLAIIKELVYRDDFQYIDDTTKGDSPTECESSALACRSMIRPPGVASDRVMLFSVDLLTEDLQVPKIPE